MPDLAIAKSLVNTNDTAELGTTDCAVVSLEVSGTWSGTLTIEATDTTAWADAYTPNVFTIAGAGAAGTMTANGRRRIDTAAAFRLRVRFSTATSGSPLVTLRAGVGSLSASGGGGGGGAVTVADGADVALGTTTDAAITTSTAGTVIGFLRGTIVQWAALLTRLPAALVGGRLDVNVGAGTVASTQSGTWTVQPGNTANTTAWKIDGSAVTQPVSAASLPLPTNAATDRATAAAPGSVELSDGAAFYTGAKTGQLPAALVSSRLDVNLGAAPSTVTVQGGAAAGAGVTGNPVQLGLKDASGNVQNVTGGAGLGAGAGALHILATNSSGTPLLVGSQATDGSNGASYATQQLNLYNGSTFDRLRNNVDATFLASAARTTTQGPTNITTYNATGLLVYVNVTSAGTGSITLSLTGIDPVSAAAYPILTGVAITTNSLTVYRVYPGLTAAANATANDRIPRVIALTITANNANSITYSVGYTLVP